MAVLKVFSALEFFSLAIRYINQLQMYLRLH